jgi:hypothetical protein
LLISGHPHMTSQLNESCYPVLYLFTGRSESLIEGVLGEGFKGVFWGGRHRVTGVPDTL